MSVFFVCLFVLTPLNSCWLYRLLGLVFQSKLDFNVSKGQQETNL